MHICRHTERTPQHPYRRTFWTVSLPAHPLDNWNTRRPRVRLYSCLCNRPYNHHDSRHAHNHPPAHTRPSRSDLLRLHTPARHRVLPLPDGAVLLSAALPDGDLPPLYALLLPLWLPAPVLLPWRALLPHGGLLLPAVCVFPLPLFLPDGGSPLHALPGVFWLLLLPAAPAGVSALPRAPVPASLHRLSGFHSRYTGNALLMPDMRGASALNVPAYQSEQRPCRFHPVSSVLPALPPSNRPDQLHARPPDPCLPGAPPPMRCRDGKGLRR